MGGRWTRRHDRACAAIRRTGCGVCADNQVVRARSAGLPHGACVQNHIPLKERAVHDFVAACPTVPAKRLCPKTRSLVHQRGAATSRGRVRQRCRGGMLTFVSKAGTLTPWSPGPPGKCDSRHPAAAARSRAAKARCPRPARSYQPSPPLPSSAQDCAQPSSRSLATIRGNFQ